MQFTIIGDANQCVVVQMTNGEELQADVRSAFLLSDGVAMEAATNSLMRVEDRPAVGSSIPLTHFRCMASKGMIALAASCAGEVREVQVKNKAWLCAREAFLVCTKDITSSIGFAVSAESGYYSEKGYALYRISGYGDLYIHCGGNVIEYDLIAGQRIAVDAGCVAAFEETIRYEVEQFEGLPNTQGGSDMVFLLSLTGPGRVYLATLPLARMALSTYKPPTPSAAPPKPQQQNPTQSHDPGMADFLKEL